MIVVLEACLVACITMQVTCTAHFSARRLVQIKAPQKRPGNMHQEELVELMGKPTDGG